jgi:glyoxylase I family protein
MPIEHVLAVVPVSDLERADAWYEALFGRPADNRPMSSLVEWQVAGAGWVQVTVDTDRAGSGLLNFAVDDLAATREELATRGVDTGEIQPVNKGVAVSDHRPGRQRDHADRQLSCEVLAKGWTRGDSRAGHRGGC